MGKKVYCSIECRNEKSKIIVHCAECGKKLIRNKSVATRTKTNRAFCNTRCSAIYINKHKKTGVRRSKLEIWIETVLREKYPHVHFIFNGKEAIGSELDIYVPNLDLAFELNGIFHYEPIHGEERLAGIQNNDNRKFQACLEKQIELCIIDTSQSKNFNVQKSIKYLDIISNIIDLKIRQASHISEIEMGDESNK